MSKNAVTVALLADTCDLNFFGQGEERCLHCIPFVFLWVQNGDIMSHCLPQSAVEMHHLEYGTAANVPLMLTYDASSVCLSVDMEHAGNTSCDIHDPV
jgi:hypothetical protein